MKKPIFRFFKRVDKANKIFVPKVVLDLLGQEYYMEIYKDKIILLPINNK